MKGLLRRNEDPSDQKDVLLSALVFRRKPEDEGDLDPPHESIQMARVVLSDKPAREWKRARFVSEKDGNVAVDSGTAAYATTENYQALKGLRYEVGEKLGVWVRVANTNSLRWSSALRRLEAAKASNLTAAIRAAVEQVLDRTLFPSVWWSIAATSHSSSPPFSWLIVSSIDFNAT